MADALLLILAAYLAVGLIFGCAFVWMGAGAIDPAAARAPLRVRALFLPGAAALWPLLLIRWHAARGRPEGGAAP